MASPVPYSVVEDDDLDDAALWAVIDSAAAAASLKSRMPLAIRNPNNFHPPSPPLKLQQKTSRNPRASFDSSDHSNSNVYAEGEVVQEPWVFRPPRKIARTPCSSSEFGEVSPMAIARTNVQQQQQQQRTPAVAVSSRPPQKYLSPEIGRFAGSECSPVSYGRIQEKESSMHSLSGNFPSVSLFKEYQNAAMAGQTKPTCILRICIATNKADASVYEDWSISPNQKQPNPNSLSSPFLVHDHQAPASIPASIFDTSLLIRKLLSSQVWIGVLRLPTPPDEGTLSG
ncbi:hypothetical protein L484_021302 [Morus notabilis]|uniref:Uncharacterized protein n=1 Tax=Morus notabilis TaxID=981085 RepID=W9S877_9ROSA|nr:hypothetical protein L484_021302 [Morus notabilis]